MKIRKQNGLTLISFLIVLSIIIFFSYMGMKIGPIYLEYYSVVTAMNGIAKERGSARYSPFDLKVKMLDRMNLSFTDQNVKDENIRVIRRNGVNLRVTYEVRKPLVGNLDVVASFDKMVRLSN